MASYRQPCVHCGAYIESDSRFCHFCQSPSPFGYRCPTCLRPIEKGRPICAGCGRALYIPCPSCGKPTFAGEKCEGCGASLMIRCQNSRCGKAQFFENTKCTACGKKIKQTRK